MVEMDFTCPESVGNMAKTAKGRFCGSCQKDLVDYSEMSQDEIQEQLKNTPGKTCGIFKTSQLRNQNHSKVHSKFKLAFTLVFLLGMTSIDLAAQESGDTLSPTQFVQNPFKTYFIEGVIEDQDSIAVPLAKVWIEVDSTISKSGILAVRTDFDGKYKIQVPQGTTFPVKLYAHSVGMDTVMVSGIVFKVNENRVEVNLRLYHSLEFVTVGLIYCPPILLREPYEIGKVKINGDDIRW